MYSGKSNWILTQSEINQLNQRRYQKLPNGFTQEDEIKLLNYQTFLLRELFKQCEIDDQLTFLCLTAQLLKRYYLQFSVFEKQDLQQTSLSCAYLALKLNEISSNNIFKMKDILKNKPKHANKVHFGDPEYAQHEMEIVESLNYKIHVPQHYQVIQSINYLFKIQNTFEQYLYDVYMKEIRRFIIRSLMNDYVFLHLHGVIAIAVCECALISVLKALNENSSSSTLKNTILGPSNRPVNLHVEEKLKQIYSAYLQQKTKTLLLLMISKQENVELKNQIQKNQLEIEKLVEQFQLQRDIDPLKDQNILCHFRNLCSNQNQNDFPKPQSRQRQHNQSHIMQETEDDEINKKRKL